MSSFERPPAHTRCRRTTVSALRRGRSSPGSGELRGFDESPVALLSGDVEIDAAWLEALWADEESWSFAVDGNVRVEGRPERLLQVTGDLHCGSVSLSDRRLEVGGRIFARDLVEAMGDDDEDMHALRPNRIVTPYLFAWFVNIDPLQISPHTTIFIIGDQDYCRRLCLPNPVLAWHEGVHALREDLPRILDSPWSDDYYWNVDRLAAALGRGEGILRPGFTPDALEEIRDAREAARIGEWRSAYLLFKAAAGKAPGYYPAWLGMAEALFEVGAYEQALPCCARAMELLPSRQRGLIDEAANLGARCALRLGRLPETVEQATRSILRNEGTKEPMQDRAHAYRFRAEARLLSGDVEGARTDLARALEIDPGHLTANWLQGLLHHRDGRTAEAARHHGIASRGDAVFSVSYDDARDTRFLAKPPVRVDWDELPEGAGALVKDEAYWERLLRDDPMQLARVPVEMRSAALCLEVLRRQAAPVAPFAAFVPRSSFTPALALELARRDGANLEWIPADLVDRELVLATPEGGRLSLRHVPLALLDAGVCLHAIRAGASLEDVPVAQLTPDLCREAVRRQPRAIQKVPAAWRTEDLWIAAMASADQYFISNHVPRRLKTPDVLAKVVALDRGALDRLPGVLVGAEVHAVAKGLYGADPDWNEIEARHGKRRCRKEHPGQAETYCWRVFWDEKFLLQEIRESRSGYRLSAHEIPEEVFTPAIAAACFESEPIHVQSIPSHLVTPGMWRRFALRFPHRLGMVPRAQRTVDVCAAAVRDDTALVSQVPAEVHAEVFDLLLREHGDSFRLGWLHLERGRGHLMATPPRLAEAMADFEAVVGGSDEDEFPASTRAQALYHLGYCRHLSGSEADARTTLRASGLEASWGGYGTFDVSADKETVDFDRQGFERRLQEAHALGATEDFEGAYAAALEAEGMLLASGNRETLAWAQVLDVKRFASHELRLWEVHDRTCRDSIERLEKATLWHYLRCDDAVRHALRAAYRNLALRTLAAEAPTRSALESALGLLDRALEIRGAAEDEDALGPCHEGRAAILLRLAKLDPRHGRLAGEALVFLRERRLAERGHVRLPEVREALGLDAGASAGS